MKYLKEALIEALIAVGVIALITSVYVYFYTSLKCISAIRICTFSY